MRNLMLLLFVAALMVGCHHSDESAQAALDSPVEVMGDTLTVPNSSTIASRLVCGRVADSAFTTTLTTTGVVMAIPSSYAEVAAPFAGRVVRSLVRMGQTVKAGTPLFEISSSDYGEVVKNYIQTKSEMDMAKRALDRTQDLHDNKVASARELDEAKTAYGLALEEYRHAAAVAKEYQIDLRNAEVGQPMVVRSPINGRVLANNLVIGEYLKEDADAKVVVADLDKVWVNANVSEMDAPYVDGIHDVEVSLVARPDSTVHGRVAYVGGILDAETRTVQTIIECANPRHLMLPNMYAQVRMLVRNHHSIVVPKGAVLQGEKGRYVLRKVGEGSYVRTAVEVQSVDEHSLRVIKGLSVGDEIVTEGAFYLVDKR
ncbi:MAG: efflux RND transporter periplasmic adaptor subunit [Bacteroidales bacterium]|nr:efflux RND transporter periplasmic adaptor subunit [Bacteroidales bacterium]